LIAIYAYYS